MANVEQIPFEVILEKTKSEILTSVNAIGQKYEMPPSVTLMVLEQIVDEAKLGSYSALIRNMPVELDKQNQNGSPAPTTQPTPVLTPQSAPANPQAPKPDLKAVPKVTPKKDAKA